MAKCSKSIISLFIYLCINLFRQSFTYLLFGDTVWWFVPSSLLKRNTDHLSHLIQSAFIIKLHMERTNKIWRSVRAGSQNFGCTGQRYCLIWAAISSFSLLVPKIIFIWWLSKKSKSAVFVVEYKHNKTCQAEKSKKGQDVKDFLQHFCYPWSRPNVYSTALLRCCFLHFSLQFKGVPNRFFSLSLS